MSLPLDGNRTLKNGSVHENKLNIGAGLIDLATAAANKIINAFTFKEFVDFFTSKFATKNQILKVRLALDYPSVAWNSITSIDGIVLNDNDLILYTNQVNGKNQLRRYVASTQNLVLVNFDTIPNFGKNGFRLYATEGKNKNTFYTLFSEAEDPINGTDNIEFLSELNFKAKNGLQRIENEISILLDPLSDGSVIITPFGLRSRILDIVGSVSLTNIVEPIIFSVAQYNNGVSQLFLLKGGYWRHDCAVAILNQNNELSLDWEQPVVTRDLSNWPHISSFATNKLQSTETEYRLVLANGNIKAKFLNLPAKPDYYIFDEVALAQFYIVSVTYDNNWIVNRANQITVVLNNNPIITNPYNLNVVSGGSEFTNTIIDSNPNDQTFIFSLTPTSTGLKAFEFNVGNLPLTITTANQLLQITVYNFEILSVNYSQNWVLGQPNLVTVTLTQHATITGTYSLNVVSGGAGLTITPVDTGVDGTFTFNVTPNVTRNINLVFSVSVGVLTTSNNSSVVNVIDLNNIWNVNLLNVTKGSSNSLFSPINTQYRAESDTSIGSYPLSASIFKASTGGVQTTHYYLGLTNKVRNKTLEFSDFSLCFEISDMTPSVVRYIYRFNGSFIQEGTSISNEGITVNAVINNNNCVINGTTFNHAIPQGSYWAVLPINDPNLNALKINSMSLSGGWA